MGLFGIEDQIPTPDIIHTYTDSLRNCNTPIVIDNGSYHCRVGWVSDDKPRLVFKNVIAKQRGKKDYEAQIGNDIGNIEVVRWLLKTQFDRDVVTQFDVQELVFDYIFGRLGINTRSKVDHPVVITETLCNPSYSRQMMSELLFECYHIPTLSYGVDCLHSFQYNNTTNKDYGIIISCGYHTTHIVPVVQNVADFTRSRRINVGGFHLCGFMHRILQLKYPAHFAAVSLSRSEKLVHRHVYLADDYNEALRNWADPDFYEKNAHIIQLPFNPLPGNNVSSVEAQKERKQQQIKRLQEMNAKRREERLAIDEENLVQLLSVQELLDDDEEEAFNRALVELGYLSAKDLQDAIDKLTARINKTKEKIADEGKEEVVDEPEPKIKRICEESNFKTQVELDAWLGSIRAKRQDLLDARVQRRQRRVDMARRRTLASQQRMKIISELASERKKEDNFGQNEDDWQVYKVINREGGDTDSEEEQEKLQELEQMLRENDPNFAKENSGPGKLDFNIAEYYQLSIGVERNRVAEALFQPSLIGIEQAGIAETLEFILSKFPEDQQSQLVQNVFLTGGCALIPGFKSRMERELQAMRPFGSSFSVSCAGNPALDGWFGAKAWSADTANDANFVTRAEYDEKGGDYLKEHSASNKFVASCINKVIGDQ